MKESKGRLLEAVLWQRPDLPALEHCRLWQDQTGFSLTGSVLANTGGTPVAIEYAVTCAQDWRTREAHVTRVSGSHSENLAFEIDDRQQWSCNGNRLAFANGLFDIDLGFSPSTNTLAIRRLQIEIGETKPVTAVWVRFPDLAVLALEQRYTRLSANRFRYESANGFTALLQVDEFGLVTDYGDWWHRIAGSPPQVTTAP